MAKKRKEARNIMKFGKNVDLERKYFDVWKTKGTPKDTIDSGFRFGQDYRLMPTVYVRLIENSVFGRKKKKRKRDGSVNFRSPKEEIIGLSDS